MSDVGDDVLVARFQQRHMFPHRQEGESRRVWWFIMMEQTSAEMSRLSWYIGSIYLLVIEPSKLGHDQNRAKNYFF